MSDAFEGLRAQGEVNRIFGETPSKELEGRFVARQRTRLEAMRRALQKIEQGTYGVCDATGERIPEDQA